MPARVARDGFAVEKKGDSEEEERGQKRVRRRREPEVGMEESGEKVEERTRCCENERLGHAVKYGFTADTYRDVYIASQPSKYAPLSRRCRQPTGHREIPPIACTPMIYLITGQDNVDKTRRELELVLLKIFPRRLGNGPCWANGISRSFSSLRQFFHEIPYLSVNCPLDRQILPKSSVSTLLLSAKLDV